MSTVSQCPHCAQYMEVADKQLRTRVDCLTCGKQFVALPWQPTIEPQPSEKGLVSPTVPKRPAFLRPPIIAAALAVGLGLVGAGVYAMRSNGPDAGQKKEETSQPRASSGKTSSDGIDPATGTPESGKNGGESSGNGSVSGKGSGGQQLKSTPASPGDLRTLSQIGTQEYVQGQNRRANLVGEMIVALAPLTLSADPDVKAAAKALGEMTVEFVKASGTHKKQLAKEGEAAGNMVRWAATPGYWVINERGQREYHDESGIYQFQATVNVFEAVLQSAQKYELMKRAESHREKAWDIMIPALRNRSTPARPGGDATLELAFRQRPAVVDVASMTDMFRAAFGGPKETFGVFARNASSRKLSDGVLAVSLLRVDGRKKRNGYYLDSLDPDEIVSLDNGRDWESKDLQRTVRFSWELLIEGRPVESGEEDLADHIARWFDSLLAEGDYTTALKDAQHLLEIKSKDGRLTEVAQKSRRAAEVMKKGHQSILAAVNSDFGWSGRWRFGKYDGILGLNFQAPSKDSAKVRLRVCEPDQRQIYAEFEGLVQFDKDHREYVLLTERHPKSGGSHVETVEPSPANYTTDHHTTTNHYRSWRLAAVDREIRATCPFGTVARFVPDSEFNESRPDLPADGSITIEQVWHPRLEALLPESLPPRKKIPIVPLPHHVGEISRMATERKFDLSIKLTDPQLFVNCVGFLGDGRRGMSSVFNPGANKVGSTSIFWNLAKGSAESTPRLLPGSINSISPDRTRLLNLKGVNEDRTIEVFDAVQGRQLSSIKRPFHPSRRYCFAWSPDSKSYAIPAGKAGAYVIDAAKGTEILHATQTTRVFSAGFSGDGMKLFLGLEDCTIAVWDLSQGKFLKFLSPFAKIPRNRPHALAFLSHADSPDVLMLAAPYTFFNGANGKFEANLSFHVLDPETGEIKQTLDLKSREIGAFAVSSDWRQLAAAWSKAITVWNLETGEVKAQLVGHTRDVGSLDFSPDGRFLLSADGGVREGALYPLQPALILWGLPPSEGDEQWLAGSGEGEKVPEPPPEKETEKETKKKEKIEKKKTEDDKMKEQLEEKEKRLQRARMLLKNAEKKLKDMDILEAEKLIETVERLAPDDPEIKAKIAQLRKKK